MSPSSDPPARPPTPRLQRLACLAVLLCVPWVTVCSPPGSGGATIWRFAIEEPVGSVQWAYAEEFRRQVAERSDGRITVEIYPYGSLGTSDHVTELLRMGAVEFATASPGHIGKLIPEAQVLLLHYVFSQDAAVNRDALRDPALRKVFDEHYSGKGFTLLSIFQEGWQVWTTKREVRSPEDFAGLRMRVMTSPMLLAAYRAYGASPTPLPYGEVYSALQLRMIDGQVNPVFAIEEMSFYEVTDFMIFPNHLPFVTTVASNEEFFDGLEQRDRQMVETIVDDLQDHIFEVQSRTNEERLDIIRERKPDMEFVELTDAESVPFRTASLEARERFVELVGPSGARVLEALLAAVEAAEDERRSTAEVPAPAADAAPDVSVPAGPADGR